MKTIINIISIPQFMNTGFNVFIFIVSNFFVISLFFMYQYVGSIWAILITDLGRYSNGTKAPHRKLEPNAITFTIPLIASFLFTSVPIKTAIVVAHIVNMSEFIINIIP